MNHIIDRSSMLIFGDDQSGISIKLIINCAVYYSALHQCSDFCYYFEAGYSNFCSAEQTEKGSVPSVSFCLKYFLENLWPTIGFLFL